MSTVVRVTDETTLPELEETLRLLCAAAKRLPHVRGVACPSAWDVQHRRIDAVLEDWCAVRDREH